MPYIDVIPEVCQFAIKGLLSNGRPAVNVIHMAIQAGIPTSRSEAIEDQARIISENWVDDVMAHINPLYELRSVDFLDLDDASGVSGSYAGDAGTFGATTGNAFTTNTSVLVHKQITSARGTRSGRLYLPAIPDLDASNTNVVVTSDFQPGMDDFLEHINQSTSITPPYYFSQLVVVHRGPHPEPIPLSPTEVEGTSSVVTALVVDSIAATQRRRMRA